MSLFYCYAERSRINFVYFREWTKKYIKAKRSVPSNSFDTLRFARHEKDIFTKIYQHNAKLCSRAKTKSSIVTMSHIGLPSLSGTLAYNAWDFSVNGNTE